MVVIMVRVRFTVGGISVSDEDLLLSSVLQLPSASEA